MDIHRAFQQGAKKLAGATGEYTDLHKSHGIDPHHWDLLTTEEPWSPDEARQIRAILAGAVEVAMTIAGMPAIPLPGQYVAALIAEIVSPVNRLVACTKAPDTFDAEVASGVMMDHEVKDMPVQQLMSLVILYSSGYPGEPIPHKLGKEVKEVIKKANQK